MEDRHLDKNFSKDSRYSNGRVKLSISEMEVEKRVGKKSTVEGLG